MRSPVARDSPVAAAAMAPMPPRVEASSMGAMNVF